VQALFKIPAERKNLNIYFWQSFLQLKRTTLMHKQLIFSAAALAILITGCADTNMSDTQRRTATGAGVGAVVGAVLSSATGGKAGTGAVVGAGVGALGTYIWSQNMEKQKREMEQATQGTGVSVSQTADNQLKLDIPSDISFDTGRSAITSNFAPVLDRFATSLRDNQNSDVRIVGHTDNTGTDAINNPLSVDRATNTRNYLTSRGVSGARIQVEGQGSYQPIASNSTAEGRARNRRVEIFVGERPR
jgi:outer membrane protein OmpA-like peptidoglycan-associated protein